MAAGLILVGIEVYPSIVRSLAASKIAIGTQLTFAPSPLRANTVFAMTCQVTSKSTTQAPIAVQAAIIQANGLVGGHFWNSAAAAEQADATYLQSGPAGVATMQADPSLRVLGQQVAGGATGTYQLWSDPIQSGSYTFVIWAWQNPTSGKLLAVDTIGLTLPKVGLTSAAVLGLQSQAVQVS
ncbi:MAG: hypothetical protein ACYCT1_08360 [Steroidobacteraceae bacterium]